MVSVTQMGQATIQGMGLRRTNLEEDRREVLTYLRNLQLIAKLEGGLPRGDVEDARRLLGDAILPSAKYSAMARDFLNADEE